MAESPEELFNALATKECVREIGRSRDRLANAQAKLDALRESRDSLILYLRSIGVPVNALAQDAGITRQSVYNVIRRKASHG